MRANAAVTRTLSQGESISLIVNGAGGSIVNGYSIYATARSQVTVFPDETFSTDINPVYWKATACLETEIGCYNTYPYAASTNDKGVICPTRPTQTDANIRINGPILYTRLYNQAGTCNQPLHYEFILPKDLSTPYIGVFKSAGKVDQGMSEYAVDNSGAASGILFKEFKDHKVVKVLPKVHPGMEWVLEGEGIATVKYDGSCCAIIDGECYKRYDCKKGKTPPEGFILVVNQIPLQVLVS